MPKKSAKSGSKQTKFVPTVPVNLQVVVEMEKCMAERIREIESLKAAHAAEIVRLEAELETKLDPIVTTVAQQAACIHAFVDMHRNVLTDGGKTKTVNLGNVGQANWATTPASVNIKNTEDVLEALRLLRLKRFIRRGPDVIDKEAMLKEQVRAKAVPGVSITQTEKFYIRLSGVRPWVESTLGKKGPGKWKIEWPKDEERQK